ncbi:hypothetical protein TNCT_716921 [Trichonephila clavata]|uniref:Uncharacterized protein n=1 Tax=Trichonephila clavata TaxID=2740835 RepID=A0A8X6I452_TRICU|nr:hypothetical protein TNCT_716921 [Trichonephila clavata]
MVVCFEFHVKANEGIRFISKVITGVEGWISVFLSLFDPQKRNINPNTARVQTLQDRTKRIKSGKQHYLCRCRRLVGYITGVEGWISVSLSWTPETKQQSSHCKSPNTPRLNKEHKE